MKYLSEMRRRIAIDVTRYRKHGDIGLCTAVGTAMAWTQQPIDAHSQAIWMLPPGWVGPWGSTRELKTIDRSAPVKVRYGDNSTLRPQPGLFCAVNDSDSDAESFFRPDIYSRHRRIFTDYMVDRLSAHQLITWTGALFNCEIECQCGIKARPSGSFTDINRVLCQTWIRINDAWKTL